MNDIRSKQINRSQDNNRQMQQAGVVDEWLSNTSLGLISNLKIFSNAESCVVSTPYNIAHYFSPH